MSSPVGLPPLSVKPEDFATPEGLATVSEWFDRVQVSINTLLGLHGPILLNDSIDMQGNRVMNASVSAPSDVITKATADNSFGAAAIKPQLEATGNAILQTTRRLNDQQQREQHSSFLNDVLNVPPVTNGCTITVVNAGGGSSTITVTASTFKWADGQIAPFAQRIDTVTNPGAGSNFYFYYFRKTDNTLQVIGPFTTNTPLNQFSANVDQKGFIGTATVVAGGGGTGGGGGSTGGGGCLEIGTPIQVPEGRNFRFFTEDCDDWIIIRFKDGRKIKAARGTMIALFKAVEDLTEHDVAKGFNDGSLVPVESIEENHDKGLKMHATVEGGVYGGDGIEFHNFKPSNL